MFLFSIPFIGFSGFVYRQLDNLNDKNCFSPIGTIHQLTNAIFLFNYRDNTLFRHNTTAATSYHSPFIVPKCDRSMHIKANPSPSNYELLENDFNCEIECEKCHESNRLLIYNVILIFWIVTLIFTLFVEQAHSMLAVCMNKSIVVAIHNRRFHSMNFLVE